ncbi:tripartite tricarboxylate transporter substrate-binding protein [Pseudoflavonifractor phocaeensis]|uniref:tripartite tricarboxylate transporter substrate-binding protein n=1 Tax=Pseudoflavonifractor phocaeensis TaxID=1870988 RepID=UPI00313E3B9A
MLKKWTSLLLVSAMALSLTACGGPKEPEGPDASGAGSGQVTADPKYPASGVLTSVIAYTAGGTSDNIVRKLSALMAEELKCSSNCVNVTGGSASVAGMKVLEEGKQGDMALGYLLPAASSWDVLGYLEGSTWSDWYSFAAVQSPFCFSVSKNSGYTTIEEVFDAAKAAPGQMKWGNAGIGSAIHLSGQMLLDAVDVDAIAVPYSGGREAATNVMAGEIDWVWASVGDVKDLLESGDLVCLGTVNTQEMEIDRVDGTSYQVPSLFDAYPEAAANAAALGYYGMALPRTTEASQLLAFQAAFDKAVNSDEFKEYAESLGMIPVCIHGEEMDKMMAQAESLYAWTLYDQNLAAKGKNPADMGIPSIADFDYSKLDLSKVNPWPQG